ITRDGRQKQYGLLTDGSRLYFRAGDLGHWVLEQVAVTGGVELPVQTQLTVTLLDISPDHSNFLIVQNCFVSGGECALWALPVLGGVPHRLGDLTGHSAAWSPDASKIAYANGHDLFVAESDGTRAHKLASLSGRAYHPQWSPDGNVLRFTLNDAKTTS